MAYHIEQGASINNFLGPGNLLKLLVLGYFPIQRVNTYIFRSSQHSADTFDNTLFLSV